MRHQSAGNRSAGTIVSQLSEGQRVDGSILIVVAFVLLAASVFQVSSGRVTLSRGGDLKLPRLCLTQQITGRDCPSCGLTRSFVALGHADFQAAWRYHRIGPLLYLLVIFQLPYRGLRMAWQPFASWSTQWDGRAHFFASITLVVLIMANWTWNLIGGP